MRGLPAEVHYAFEVEDWRNCLAILEAEDTAHLYLWTPNALLPEALGVMRAWGFE